MADRVPFWRQRLPFSGLLASAIAGIFLADRFQLAALDFAIGFGAALAIWIFHRREAWVFLAAAFSFAAIHTWQTRESPSQFLAEALGEESHIATVHGRVIGHSNTREGLKSRFILEVEEIDWSGGKIRPACRILVLAPVEAPQWNDRIEAVGTLRRILVPRNPGQFDARSHLAIQGITCELLVTTDSDIVIHPGTGFSIPRLASKSRRWMESTLREGISSDTLVCNLLAGLVLGATSEIPESLQDQFRQTGTYHIFSVSGLHVGMITYILWQLLRAFSINPRVCVAIIIPAVFFYSLVTGWKPSSVRAATMTAIFLLGLVSSRQPVPLNSLCAAAFLILAQSTNQLFNPGFQLSVIVVAAILVFASPLQTHIRARLDPDPFIPPALWNGFQKTRHSIGLWFAGLVAVSIAAWIGSLPLMIAYFNLVSLSALIANPFVVPLAFVIMAAALASLSCGLVATVLSAALNNANLVLVKILLLLIESLSALPGSYFTIGPPPASPVSVTVFDFGRGAATAVRTGGTLWLIDCGTAWDFETTLRPWMRRSGKPRPDGLVVSHGDSRHIGSASLLLEGWPSPRIVDSHIKDRSSIRRRLHAELEAGGIPKSLHRSGDTLHLSRHARLRFLHPPATLDAARSNDKALVPLLETSWANILFLSDSGPEVWEHLPSLRADILVIGRHHTGMLPGAEFLENSGIRAVIATVADYPPIEAFDIFWAGMLDELAIELFRLDHTGAVQIEIDPRSTKISAFLNGQSLQIPR